MSLFAALARPSEQGVALPLILAEDSTGASLSLSDLCLALP